MRLLRTCLNFCKYMLRVHSLVYNPSYHSNRLNCSKLNFTEILLNRVGSVMLYRYFRLHRWGLGWMESLQQDVRLRSSEETQKSDSDPQRGSVLSSVGSREVVRVYENLQSHWSHQYLLLVGQQKAKAKRIPNKKLQKETAINSLFGLPWHGLHIT